MYLFSHCLQTTVITLSLQWQFWTLCSHTQVHVNPIRWGLCWCLSEGEIRHHLLKSLVIMTPALNKLIVSPVRAQWIKLNIVLQWAILPWEEKMWLFSNYFLKAQTSSQVSSIKKGLTKELKQMKSVMCRDPAGVKCKYVF